MRIWPAFLFLAASFGQDFQISGTVVNSVTGAPVAGAVVAARALAGERGAKAGGVALSETGGAFRIGGLAKGQYLFRVEKPGYVQDDEPGAPPIELGPSREGILVKLKPLGKIFGAVTDRDGRPVSQAAIRALRGRIQDGRRVWTQARSVTTDDLGRYRLWNLDPGEYHVVAAGRGGGTALVVGYTPAMVNSHESFAPVYYGGASDRAAASPIPLAAGQEFEANLRVTLRPAYRVRGRMQNVAPSQPVRVELLRGGQDVSATRAFVNAATGMFELQDIVPGTYLLRATQGSGDAVRMVERELEVREGDLEGVGIALAEPVEIPVNIRFAADPGTLGTRGIPASVVLEKDDATRVAFRDGERWVVRNVFPGRYRVRVTAMRGYVLSASAGNQDLLSTPDLIVSSGTPAIEVVLDPEGGMIQGTAPHMDGLQLLLVPSGGGDLRAEPVFQGLIRLTGLAPGNYNAYLVKGDEIEYRNPEVLRRLGGGVPVRIEKGATVKLDLKEVNR